MKERELTSRFYWSLLLLIAIVSTHREKMVAQGTEEPSKVAPKFSVVSIRPSGPEGPFLYKRTADGVIESRNTLFWLIQMAYDLPEERFLERAPSWVGEQRYDITAKVDEVDQAALTAMSRADRDKMLQPILVDRFGLTYHWDSRIFPEYALVLKKPGQTPTALVPSTPEESAKPVWRVSHPYSVDARGISMEQLCNLLLGTEAQRLVADQTGLTGKYTFHLSWNRVDTSVTPSQATDPNSAPDIFTAVQQQLGLKMIPIKAPVKVMVIDGIHKPSDN
jgi:bla regulator protein BlaR1